MLVVYIHNDGTGTDEAANYDVHARVNGRLIAAVHVTGHRRANGWRDLLRMIADTSEGDDR